MNSGVRINWKTVEMKSICDIGRGASPRPILDPKNYGGGIPWIKISDATASGKFIKSTKETVTELGASKSRYLKAGSLIVANSGTVGFAKILGIDGCIHDGWLFLTNFRDVTSDYLYYCINYHRPHLDQLASGVTQKNLNTTLLKEFKILLPSLQTQRKIADILSAYDDLIENNMCRIAILEEMAQSLYREWFVHFRFPGHEKKRLVESTLGVILEGWEVVKVSSALEIDPPTKVPKDGEKPFISMASLSNNSMLIDDIELRTGNSGAKFKNGDTLFARITPCLENGKTGYVQFLPSADSVAFGSTEFIVLRSRTLCPEYVYLMARSNEFRDNAIKSMTGATGRQRVQVACFDKFLLTQPDNKTLAAFRNMVTPLFHNIYILAQKNTNLRKTRDLLLPKLISGEVDVERLEVAGVDETGEVETKAIKV